MASAEILDEASLNMLLESLGGDRAFLAELIDTYLSDATDLFAALQQGLAANNAEEVRRAAHSLKSNSASFGALTLAEMSRAVEDRGKAGALDGLQEQVEQMQSEYQRVSEALIAVRSEE